MTNKYRQHTEFFSLLTLLISTRVADGILTYKITPNLSRELNPLVSIFGVGWAGLIAVALAIIIPTVILTFYNIYKPFDNFPEKKNASYLEFKKFYFNASNSTLKTSSGKIIIHTLGYIVPRALILWGVWVIIHNYLVLLDEPTYKYLRSEYKIWIVGYLLPGLFGVLLSNPFLKREYKRYIITKK